MKKSIKFLSYFFMVTALLLHINCKEKESKKNIEEPSPMNQNVSIKESSYGTTADGQKVKSYQLKNKNGIEVNIITFGGRITSLIAPDSKDVMENVILGFDSLQQYETKNPFFGALIGRYGNRIAKGKFTLEGTEYDLAKNNGENNLHGGLIGFDKVVWSVEETTEGDSASLKLSYLSEDMEEGFPGNLKTYVTYTLNSNNSLTVLYEATTDKSTVVNLTQHSYFNLSGDFSTTIEDHIVEIDADSYLPVDAGLIPTGELASVEGTPFDFRKAKLVSNEINADDEQINLGGGYDHCWVLNNQNMGMRNVATAYYPANGRVLNVSTTEPGMQFYTGNFIDGTLSRTDGVTYAKRSGFCLETQHYPDSPNQSQFPSATLVPGVKYVTQTTFTFSTK